MKNKLSKIIIVLFSFILIFVGLIIVIFISNKSTNDTRSHASNVLNNPLISASVTLVGPVETVFKYSDQACESLDIPDTPARAFRDSDGMVNLISTHYVGYRSIGPDLNKINRDCKPIMRSKEDTLQSNAKFHDWIVSPYTIDGINVVSLVHSEWYGYLSDSKCLQSNQVNGWVNALTQVVSHNKGLTYQHEKDYKVWVSPTTWNSSFKCDPKNYTQYGAYLPSNIVYKDSYYYSLYRTIADPMGYSTETGICVMRSKDITKASMWEKLTNNGWDSSVQAKCKPVLSKIATLAFEEPQSLTYNTYLKKYILLVNVYDSKTNKRANVSLVSSDLIDWSNPVQIQGLPSGYIALSLLDTTDSSRNFENTTQNPYLYYVRTNSDMDRDLVRQKVRIESKIVLTPPNITSLSISPTPTLAAPDNLSARCGINGNAIFRWSFVPGASKYSLYINDTRNDNGSTCKEKWYCPKTSSWDIIAENLTTNYYSHSLAPGQTFTWWVQAVSDTVSSPTQKTITCPLPPTPTLAQKQATFTASPMSGRAPLLVSFSATNLTPGYYKINFGDGIEQLTSSDCLENNNCPSGTIKTHLYKNGGNFQATLVGTKGIVNINVLDH